MKGNSRNELGKQTGKVMLEVQMKRIHGHDHQRKMKGSEEE